MENESVGAIGWLSCTRTGYEAWIIPIRKNTEGGRICERQAVNQNEENAWYRITGFITTVIVFSKSFEIFEFGGRHNSCINIGALTVFRVDAVLHTTDSL